jgi:protection of telomeres protein 1
VQKYHGPESLVTHHSTTLHVYSAKVIPKPPQSAQKALTKAKKGNHVPTDKEHAFVSWLYHNINKDSLPDEAAFQRAIAQSMNVKDKFSLLQDVADGRFYDILGRVVREPFPSGDRATLYVTDYTENAKFFDAASTGPRDPYGYTSKDGQDAKWFGPPGRRTIQVTCYEPHATVVQQEVQAGDWISLRNVQIKFGSNGRNLEGFLRGDPNAIDLGRTNVDVRDFNNEGDLDQRAKDALRRWREYEKTSKRRRSGKEDVDGVGSNAKRKADGEGGARLNAKQRRKLKRQEAEKKAKEDAAKADMRRLAIQDQLEVNQYSKWSSSKLGSGNLTMTAVSVRCEGQNAELVPISKICQPTAYETLIDGQAMTVDLPFICRKHKTIARVTDFRPSRLEDFASGRKRLAWDLLSDNSEDSASASDESADGSGSKGQQVWEWRFALELEDASSKELQPQRIWAVVDNAEAQLLMDLDASK